jgi:hypothetical protein
VTIKIEKPKGLRGKGGDGSGSCYPLASIFGEKKPFGVRDSNRAPVEGRSFAKNKGTQGKSKMVYSASYKENFAC